MSRRSKKRSATSSGEQAELVFFVDRSLGRGDVPDALEGAGAQVERHDTHFEKDTEDAVWIEDVCKRGWIILTKDKAIRRRADERQRIIDGGRTRVLSDVRRTQRSCDGGDLRRSASGDPPRLH